MEKTQSLREKKISPTLLSGFSTGVERLIRERNAERQKVVRPQRSFRSIWAGVPVAAVLLIGVAVVLRLPSTLPSPMKAQQTLLAAAPSSVLMTSADEINEDIAVLRELGVWTDEDDNNIGAGSETSLEDLELTDASVQKQSRLA